jgi:hypothetical protein
VRDRGARFGERTVDVVEQRAGDGRGRERLPRAKFGAPVHPAEAGLRLGVDSVVDKM